MWCSNLVTHSHTQTHTDTQTYRHIILLPSGGLRARGPACCVSCVSRRVSRVYLTGPQATGTGPQAQAQAQAHKSLSQAHRPTGTGPQVQLTRYTPELSGMASGNCTALCGFFWIE
jgi:hypothetical protein